MKFVVCVVYDSWIHSFFGTTNPRRGGGECKAYSSWTVHHRVDRIGQTNKHSLVPQIRRTDLSEIRVFGVWKEARAPRGSAHIKDSQNAP